MGFARVLRAHAGFLSLPWPLLAHSQYLYPPLIQSASFAGAYGVSFLIVAVNAAQSEVVLRLTDWRSGSQVGYARPGWWKAPAIALLLVATAAGYGLYALYVPVKYGNLPYIGHPGNIPKASSGIRSTGTGPRKHVVLSETAALANHRT